MHSLCRISPIETIDCPISRCIIIDKHIMIAIDRTYPNNAIIPFGYIIVYFCLNTIFLFSLESHFPSFLCCIGAWASKACLIIPGINKTIIHFPLTIIIRIKRTGSVNSSISDHNSLRNNNASILSNIRVVRVTLLPIAIIRTITCCINRQTQTKEQYNYENNRKN